MDTPDFPGYDQLVNGVYRKNIEDDVDEIIVLLRSYIPTQDDIIEYLVQQAKHVELSGTYEERVAKKLRYEGKQTQALLYAMPLDFLMSLKNNEVIPERAKGAVIRLRSAAKCPAASVSVQKIL